MNLDLLLIVVFAVWRLTSLVSGERGLLGVATAIRRLFGVEHDLDGEPLFDSDGQIILNSVSGYGWVDRIAFEIAAGITCFWCCSVWMAAAVLLLFRLDVPSFILYTLAVSGGAIVLESVREAM